VIYAPAEQVSADAEVSRALVEVGLAEHPGERAASWNQQDAAEPIRLCLLSCIPMAASADANRGCGFVLEDYMCEFVGEAVGAATRRVTRVVDDKSSCPNHNHGRRKASLGGHQSPDALLTCSVLAQLAERDNWDTPLLGEREAIEAIESIETEIVADELGDALGIALKPSSKRVRHDLFPLGLSHQPFVGRSEDVFQRFCLLWLDVARRTQIGGDHR
jgi:hypothetical protein